jgi:type IV pilus assembly protein PilC
MGTKSLAALCRRLATSLGAGVDVRAIFSREALAGRGAARSRFADISEAIDRGSTITDALEQTGNYFPHFFRAVVEVGETSGHLPEVFRRLAEHYEHQLKMRRVFLAAITWPVIELTLSLGVIGLLIWLMGAIPALKKSNTDILGFGLTGTSGLITYLGFLAAVAVVGFLLFRAMSRGVFWLSPVQWVLMKVPQLGSTLETLALARLAWTLHVTLNSGMQLRPALKMSLASTNNVVYTRHTDQILAAIRSGREMHEAFAETGAFPIDFIDVVQVGEQSGRVVESLAHLSEQYQDRARLAMNTLAILMGVAVTGLIAAAIIFVIYQIFTRAYLQPINDALKMKI